MAERPACHLLVVEDETNLGSTLTERLSQDGYTTTWARSLRQARQELFNNHFHLALVDVGLPDGLGFTLAEEIQRRCPSTAIIFLTAMGDAHHRVQGLELGAEDYVVKPFHFQELVLRIENALKRRRHWEDVPQCVQVGRASIDFNRLEAKIGDKVSPLSPREAALMRFLIARRGTVVSRDEILDEVWSRDEYPTPRTVDNFVMKLRRLVETDPEHPSVIRTVWGAGYQLHLEADFG